MFKSLQTKSQLNLWRLQLLKADKKGTILILFFDEHLKQIEIAKILNVSKQYVSKVVKSDSRYSEAKQNKISKNAIKRKEYLQEYYQTYQRPKKEDTTYEVSKAQQIQDSLELSFSNGSISDYAFAKWNINSYHRNKKGNLVLNKGLNVGFDVPKTINMNIPIPSQKFKHPSIIWY